MSQVKLGDKNIPFIYQGNELLYPNPVKDGLVLYYDFKGMKNSDVSKNVARDLSGNGNNGVLQNFVYNSESGYNDGLKFDGVDDAILNVLNTNKTPLDASNMSISMVLDSAKIQTAQYFIQVTLSDGKFILLYRSSIDKLGYFDTFKSNKYLNFIPETNEKFLFTLNINNKQVDLRVNNEKFALFEDTGLKNASGVSLGVQKYNGTMKSIKIYNRALTEEEIQKNALIEKERWGL
ncbi:hypothetical protein HSZ50_09050 [Staphylococcus saprophyticus]|uniref:hypothetical protein n=1 Tax=Staphylococcus saprophyticus TaxID=29385 RepID=UPI00157C74F8|nr:hypothetical protein [Staphylococcus saprophyticus]QKQ32194.1 hypothetical protein HSZ50_09050 [Staphylococcus saprophyticus]